MNLSVPVDDGVRLCVRHRPGTRSPAFLLVHGLDSSARMWDQVADHLAAAGHPAFAVDLRGHGESDIPDHGYDTETAAVDLAAICATLRLTGSVVAGHSWGAHIALRLAAEHPTLVAGLAMVEGGWATPAAVYGSWKEFVTVTTSLASLPPSDRGGVTPAHMRDYLRAVHPDWSPEAIEASLFSLRVGPDGFLAPALSAPHRTMIVRSLWDDPPARWYSAVTAPVLLMPAIPRISTRWPPSIRTLVERIRSSVDVAAATLPNATISEYLESDHDLHAQHPGRVATDLLQLARTGESPMKPGVTISLSCPAPGQ
jgi:pimeloyl-ACP methyl ester carboxylesterase